MGSVMEIKDYDFEEEVLQAEELVLVDFFAHWCGPCRMLGPVLEEMAEEYAGKLKVVKVNVDENSLTAANFKVMSIPTVIFFRQGEPVETLIGFNSKEDLVKVVDGLLS